MIVKYGPQHKGGQNIRTHAQHIQQEARKHAPQKVQTPQGSRVQYLTPQVLSKSSHQQLDGQAEENKQGCDKKGQNKVPETPAQI